MAIFKFTLLLYFSLVLAVAASSNPNTFGIHRRGHADLGRLVKKRTPADILANESSAQTASPTQGTSAVAQTSPTNSASVQTTSVAAASPSASPSTTGGSSVLSSVVGELLPTGSSTASSAVPTTTSSTSSHSSSTPQTSAHASTAATTPTQSILYLTSGSTPTPTQTSTASSDSGMSPTAMTALIVIAASVGAAVIGWTIIRKWKFRPSSDFEGRMQPIDWQPGGSNEDADLPSQHRPLSRASSFHSGSGNAHVDDQMRGPVGGYGAPALSPIPDHDFTAGPVHLAPVGGYADLARRPSLQPMMQESLAPAPSINRPVQYDQYGVPLHHGYNGY